MLRAVLVLVAALIAGVCWAASSPLGASPDDDYHQASIWCPTPFTADGCNPETDPATGHLTIQVPKLVVKAACYAFSPATSASCQTNESGLARTDRFDQGGYPGGYYDFMHLFVGDDVVRSVLTMRIFNAFLGVGLFAGVAWTLNRAGRRMLSLAVLVTTMPLGIFLWASINPSSWAFTGVTCAWLAIHAFFTATERPKQLVAAALALLAAIIAAVARADAGAYLVVVAGAMVLLHLPQVWPVRKRSWLAALPVVIAVIGLIGFRSAGQAGALTGGLTGSTEDSASEVLFNNLLQVPALVLGVFDGSLGWLDTATPGSTWVPAVLVFAGVLFVGLRRLDLRKVLVLLGLTGVLIGLPLLLLQLSMNLVGTNVQSRYLLPLLPALVGVALIGVDRLTAARLSRGQALAVWFGLSVANAVMLMQNIRRYTTGLDLVSPNLNAGIEWWWASGPKPLTVWFLGSLAYALWATVLFYFGVAESPKRELVGASDATDPARRAASD